MKQTIIGLGLGILSFTTPSLAQESFKQSNYRLYVDHPALSITRTQADTAVYLSDLNNFFKAEWVKEYYSVNVKCIVDGKPKNASNKSDALSNEQKLLIQSCDPGTSFSIQINYLPDNTLSVNEPKDLSYSILIRPDLDASFHHDAQSFDQYILDKAISKIDADHFGPYQVAMISFTIDTNGQVIEVETLESSRDQAIDSILLHTICEMPQWKNAKYSNNTKVSQNFVLAVGSMESCSINQINIDRE